MKVTGCLTGLLATLLFVSGLSGEEKPAPARNRVPVRLTEEGLRIHREALLIDGHNDLPWQFRQKADLSFQNLDISRPQKSIHTDLPRLRKGGVGAQFWAAYVPVESGKKGTAVRETLEQIDVIHRMVQCLSRRPGNGLLGR